MSTVKKAFQPIAEFLEANKDQQVSAILPGALALMAPKARGATAGGTTFIKDVDGNTVAINDYYFKKWMPLVGDEAVEFGAKATSATGLSNMSKEGTSLWTKQQRVAKQAMQDLLVSLEDGSLAPADIGSAKESIEAERKSIAETDSGFDTIEEVKEYLEANGVTLAEDSDDSE